jgi:hypothetical protein
MVRWDSLQSDPLELILPLGKLAKEWFVDFDGNDLAPILRGEAPDLLVRRFVMCVSSDVLPICGGDQGRPLCRQSKNRSSIRDDTS